MSPSIHTSPSGTLLPLDSSPCEASHRRHLTGAVPAKRLYDIWNCLFKFWPCLTESHSMQRHCSGPLISACQVPFLPHGLQYAASISLCRLWDTLSISFFSLPFLSIGRPAQPPVLQGSARGLCHCPTVALLTPALSNGSSISLSCSRWRCPEACWRTIPISPSLYLLPAMQAGRAPCQ